MKKRKADFLSAYENALGNVSTACRQVRVSRQTFYNWLITDTSFKEKVEEIDESNLDFAETMLLKNIREGKESSIFFFLKTKGKKRGYVERQEFTGKDGKELVPTTFVFGNENFVESYGAEDS